MEAVDAQGVLHWEASSGEEADYCDCPGPPPPPQFLLPPPPPPPALQDSLCREADLQFCQLEPVGAEYTQTAFPSLPIVVVCSSVVLVALLVASFLLWKHKKKVQNFLPCKAEHQGHCDLGGPGGVTYDDVLINRHPTRLPGHHAGVASTGDPRALTPIEVSMLLDVKYGSYGPTPLSHTNFTFPEGGGKTAANGGTGERHHRHHHHHHHHSQRSGKSKDHFNPIYEEVSGASEDNKPTSRSYDSDIEDSEVEERTVASEDEFAEDELSLAEYPRPATNGASRPCSGTSSLQGSTGGDLCRDVGSDDGTENPEPKEPGLTSKCSRVKQPKHTHSLERNKDGHPSEGFLAKQSYYMSKSMLGPDLSAGGPKGSKSVANVAEGDASQGLLPNHSTYSLGREPSRSGYPGVNQLDGGVDTPPPYSAGYVHGGGLPFSAKVARLPGALLSELNHKLVGGNSAPGRTMSVQRPVFTVEPEDGFSGRGVLPPSARDFSTFHPYPPGGGGGGGGGPTENIYATVDEEGPPFTIDLQEPPYPASRAKAEAGKRHKGGPNKDKGKGQHHIPNQRLLEDQDMSYGDIRPIYDTRTVCT